jgi:hypothetical protein
VIRGDLSGAPSQTVDVAAYENDILHALVKSGGVPAADVDAVVIIQRRGTDQKGSPVSYESRVPLRARRGESPPKDEDVELYNGDVLIVESRPTDQKPANVAESPPMLTFAVAAPDGRILVQLPGAGGNGPWQLFDAEKVSASESDGRAIDSRTLAERLKTMTTVLVATDGRAPTAAHLRAVKPGTLVLTVQTAP